MSSQSKARLAAQALTAMDVPESLARTLWNIIQRMQPANDKKAPAPLRPTSDLKYPGLAMPDTRFLSPYNQQIYFAWIKSEVSKGISFNIAPNPPRSCVVTHHFSSLDPRVFAVCKSSQANQKSSSAHIFQFVILRLLAVGFLWSCRATQLCHLQGAGKAHGR